MNDTHRGPQSCLIEMRNLNIFFFFFFLPRTFALEEVFKYCLTEMILLGVFGGFAMDENSKPSLAMYV